MENKINQLSGARLGDLKNKHSTHTVRLRWIGGNGSAIFSEWHAVDRHFLVNDLLLTHSFVREPSGVTLSDVKVRERTFRRFVSEPSAGS